MITQSSQAISVQSQPSFGLRFWRSVWQKPVTPAIAPPANEANSLPVALDTDQPSLAQTYSFERRTFM